MGQKYVLQKNTSALTNPKYYIVMVILGSKKHQRWKVHHLDRSLILGSFFRFALPLASLQVIAILHFPICHNVKLQSSFKFVKFQNTNNLFVDCHREQILAKSE